jgi:glycosyltransferase involved in cell wall biosynthesis
MSATFSAVIVVRNEEALIQRFLGSIAWCDERIVIDGFCRLWARRSAP